MGVSGFLKAKEVSARRRAPGAGRRITGTAFAALSTLLLSCGDSAVGPAVDDFEDEPAPIPRPEVVVFANVNLVAMDADVVLFDQTVVVRGERIVEVGPAAFTDAPDGAFQIDGYGRYLMPGLADMHVHVTQDTFEEMRNDFVLYLANGVTTNRVMWGGPGILGERERVASGESLGPTQLVASPGIDGPDGVWTGSTPPVTSAEEARLRTAEHAAAGYDFIKVYNDLDDPMYDAIVDEAAAHGIPIVGHVPWRVGVERAQDAGQLTSEHFVGIKNRAATPYWGGSLDESLVDELAARSNVAGLWHTPTISVDALSMSRVAEIRGGADLTYVSPGMRRFFEDGFHHGLDDEVAGREARNHYRMARAIRDRGGRVLVGTDAGFGWILPGYSIHDELEHLVASGFSPFQALRGATHAAAESVGQAGEFGRVVVGARADLLLLTRNPLSDVSALRHKSGTMVRGRWLSRGTLDDMLEAIRDSYRSSATNRLERLRTGPKGIGG